MGEYYSFLANIAAVKNVDPVWTTPYFDASGLGTVITVSRPLYNNGNLSGVSGVDLTIPDLLGDAAFFGEGSLSYAFVVDDRGCVRAGCFCVPVPLFLTTPFSVHLRHHHSRAILHPSLVLPTEVNEPPVLVDISLLEVRC